jgi:hypothetical protein
VLRDANGLQGRLPPVCKLLRWQSRARKGCPLAGVQHGFLQDLVEWLSGLVWRLDLLSGEMLLALEPAARSGAVPVRRVSGYQCGPQALIALINFLVGLILAFVGAIVEEVQCRLYRRPGRNRLGAGNGCVMTAIILWPQGNCLRGGARDYEGQRGISAANLRNLTGWFFIPRMVALMLVMPFLCAFC